MYRIVSKCIATITENTNTKLVLSKSIPLMNKENANPKGHMEFRIASLMILSSLSWLIILYGCTLWKLNKMCTNDICTSWNKAIRKVWKLPPTAHTCFLRPFNGQLHILDQIVICFIRFYNRLVSSDNSILSFIARVSMSNRMSYLRSNILYIKWKYDVDITATNIQQCVKCVYDGYYSY